jgi:hypothetical protein
VLKISCCMSQITFTHLMCWRCGESCPCELRERLGSVEGWCGLLHRLLAAEAGHTLQVCWIAYHAIAIGWLLIVGVFDV